MATSEKMPFMDQNYASSKGFDPISELMRAIILRTIDDYNSLGELHGEAAAYLWDEEDEYVFSFRFICEYLGLNPEKTRDRIMNPQNGRISTRRRTLAD